MRMSIIESAAGPRPPRILEINSVLFRRAVPEQTDCFRADRKKRGSIGLLGPRAFFDVLRRLRAREYDMVVIEAPALPHWHPRSFLTAIRDWRLKAPSALFAIAAAQCLHRLHDVPIAAIDTRDSFSIGRHNFGLLDACHSFFKRELPVDRWQVFFKQSHWDLPGRRWRSKTSSQRRIRKLRPISLGYIIEPTLVAQPEKTTDVFFAGDVYPNSTIRTDGLEELRALRDEGYRIDIPEARLDRGAFAERLASAHLAWSPAGYGWDCYRHYEAPLAGTTPLINYPTVARYAPMIDGKHCLFYAPEPGELARAVRRALADKPALSRIAAEAKAHVEAHHTLRARADHIVATVLGRHLDGTPVEKAIAASVPEVRQQRLSMVESV